MTRHYYLTKEENPLKIISWGCGVQSTALSVMSALGDFEKVDVIISADTQWERNSTYLARNFYKNWLEEHGMKIQIVTAGSIKTLEKPHNDLPLWCSKTGAPLRRQCTSFYKIIPIQNFIRKEYLQTSRVGGRIKKESVYMYLGISLDEFTRMKDSRVDYILNKYPLVDMRLTRDDCENYLKEKGLPIPPKSSCVCCPYTSAERWKQLKDESREEWNEVVEYDKKIRVPPKRMVERGYDFSLYLWKNLKPLDEEDFDKYIEENPQTDVCESGYCFV